MKKIKNIAEYLRVSVLWASRAIGFHIDHVRNRNLSDDISWDLATNAWATSGWILKKGFQYMISKG